MVAILWEWTDGAHKGARFYGCHGVENDGRIRDWPKLGLRPLGAVKVSLSEGDGMDLIEASRAKSPADQ